MSTLNFTTTLRVNRPPAEVCNSIMNVAAWWQGEIRGISLNVNDEFTYQMKEHHFSKQRLIEYIPEKLIVWQVTDSQLSAFQNQSEWTGTKIIFEISEVSGETILVFTHQGLVPQFECFGGCSWAWEKLIQESLFSLITTGKGANIFNESI